MNRSPGGRDAREEKQIAKRKTDRQQNGVQRLLFDLWHLFCQVKKELKKKIDTRRGAHFRREVKENLEEETHHLLNFLFVFWEGSSVQPKKKENSFSFIHIFTSFCLGSASEA
jgi:hypothetical protein